MRNILVVVDMQNDFIDGALGSEQAVAIVEHVVNKIKDFNGEVVFTKDTHFEDYLDSQEGKKLPVKHCIKNTDGWQLNERIAKAMPQGAKGFDKVTFGSRELIEYLVKADREERLGYVEFVGLCTDICVISNAISVKTFLPEVELRVDGSCCAGVTKESHENALNAMKMCQIQVTG